MRAAPDRRLVAGGGALTALRAARAMGAGTVPTQQGEAVVCVAWRTLELLPPRQGPTGRAPLRVQGVRVWNGTLEWLLLTTRPVESLDQALELIAWYSRRWVVEEFHKAWKTGCRAEQRRLSGRAAAAVGPSSGGWRKRTAWCRCSGLWLSSPFVCCWGGRPPTASKVPDCGRCRSQTKETVRGSD